MKILIDITEDTYNSVCNESMLPPNVRNVIDGIKNGQSFFKNVTNGDMIKAMFPKVTVIVNENLGEKGTVFVIFKNPETVILFDLDWWSAPYKEV